MAPSCNVQKDIKYVIKFHKMELHIPVYTMYENVYSRTMDELKTETALMHIKKTNVDTYAINNGSPCFIVNTLFRPGDCPGRFL